MPMLQPTKDLLQFLQKNPAVRAQIRAAPDKTLLYAGSFFKPVWRELAELKLSSPQIAAKQILPEVLERIRVADQACANLLAWAQDIDKLQPWKENGFIIWRALSGLYAANAVGSVSFYVAAQVLRNEKVFAATEIAVLSRNPNVDATTKDVLAYYQRCLQSKQANMNFGYIAG